MGNKQGFSGEAYLLPRTFIDVFYGNGNKGNAGFNIEIYVQHTTHESTDVTHTDFVLTVLTIFSFVLLFADKIRVM